MTENVIAQEIVDAAIKKHITRIVNGLQDDDHAKSPSRKEAQGCLV